MVSTEKYSRWNPRSTDQKLEIIKLYHIVQNVSKMERDYKIPHTSITAILDEYKVPRYIPSKNISKVKTCQTYKDKFNTLSDSTKGYICGLIATDGSLDKNRKRIEISQCAEDKEIILELSKILADPAIKVSKRGVRKSTTHKVLSVQDQYRVAAVLPDLYDFCLSIGMTPNKTMTLDVDLSSQTQEFKNYFLRGCIDWDGMVKVGKELVSSEIRIVSASSKFLDSLEEIFGGTRSGNMQTSGSMLYYLCFTGNVGKLLAHYLPKEKYMLARKSNKMREFCMIPSKKNPSYRVVNRLEKIERLFNHA